MRNLVAVEFLSVDGVTQGLASPEAGFDRGGWGVPYGAAVTEVVGGQDLAVTTSYLLGRRTYQELAAFWPTQPDENPMAASLNRATKYVATRTLQALDWQGAEVLDGELASAVATLKTTGEGDLVILGSGTVLRQLLAHGLVDVLRLYVHPVLVGAGSRLFGELPDLLPLRLVDVATTSLDTVALSYQPAR